MPSELQSWNCGQLTQQIVEKERKKAEKQAKFDQKKAKAAAATPAATSKSKEKKAKAEKKAEEGVLPAYVEETPAGDKKSMFWNKYLPIIILILAHSNQVLR